MNPVNREYVEDLYWRFQKDPSSVSANWREYFLNMERNPDFVVRNGSPDGDYSPASFNLLVSDKQARTTVGVPGGPALLDQLNTMLQTIRTQGHKVARINPLSQSDVARQRFALRSFGFTDAHSEMLVSGQGTHFGGPLSLSELHEHLLDTYCGSVGVEFMHIEDETVKNWLFSRLESPNDHEPRREERLHILTKLTDAVTFEEFIQKKFRGAKSFSLQGAESLLPLLDFALAKAAEQGIREVVLAMAHRGRLNVLANIIGKPKWQIFREFDDSAPDGPAEGDVRYHLGHSNDYETPSGRKVHVSLCFNPSHLEFVNPVALGRMRAKQDRTGDSERERGMTVMIHGDASFAGEGIVQETLNLSQLGGYTAGGTLHVVINNQIGF
ncbi:MAG: thiamine pyrophosphate-dependent enzyme, partial [Candidatus Binatia bacterium]